MYEVTIIKNGTITMIDYLSGEKLLERFASVARYNHAGYDYTLETHYDGFHDGLVWYSLTFESKGVFIRHEYVPVKEV